MTLKTNEVDEGVFFVGKPGERYLVAGVWISDEERSALESLRWYTPVNVRTGKESWMHMPVDVFQKEYDLAHTDPSRRSVQEGTFIPFTWLVGGRIGY